MILEGSYRFVLHMAGVVLPSPRGRGSTSSRAGLHRAIRHSDRPGLVGEGKGKETL